MNTIKRIEIEFIPQSEHRYDTCGDWLRVNGDGIPDRTGTTLLVRVSVMSDERHQQLVAVHELVEALSCNVDGVSPEAVDAFDMGPGADLDEPGNSPDAPYHTQHMMATEIEKRLAEALHVEWDEYDAAVGNHGVRD